MGSPKKESMEDEDFRLWCGQKVPAVREGRKDFRKEYPPTVDESFSCSGCEGKKTSRVKACKGLEITVGEAPAARSS